MEKDGRIGDVAQLGEHCLCKAGVAGSTPVVSNARQLQVLGLGIDRQRGVGEQLSRARPDTNLCKTFLESDLRRRKGLFPKKSKKLPKPLDDANGSGYKLLSRQRRSLNAATTSGTKRRKT